MSQWHREHPELAGTAADPWMQIEGHRLAYEELSRGRIIPRSEEERAALRDELEVLRRVQTEPPE